MPNLTIRNLQDDLIQRIKTVAAAKGHTVEQEIREILEIRYLEIRYGDRSPVIEQIRQRWSTLPNTTPQDVKHWRSVGRISE
ncbi:MAG: hypothetical protein ACFB5Z_04530 [Elainellaceae cyanobacterium]